MALDTSGPAETESGFNYRKLGNVSIVMGGVDPVPVELTIPGTLGGSPVAGIWNDALMGKSLTSVDIPASVITIAVGAFGENPLESINVASGNQNYSSRDGILYDKAGTGLIVWPSRKFPVVIPNDVTSIGQWAFFGNEITSVTIPDNVATIGDLAFSYCRLTSITIPSSVISIGDYAFYRNDLTSVTIPASFTNIGASAFGYNDIVTITIGANANIFEVSEFDEFPTMGNYGASFLTLYNDNGKLPGTYTRANRNWTRQP